MFVKARINDKKFIKSLFCCFYTTVLFLDRLLKIFKLEF